MAEFRTIINDRMQEKSQIMFREARIKHISKLIYSLYLLMNKWENLGYGN